MNVTLIYQGPLPSKRRGISETVASLRSVFHHQLKAQLSGHLTHPNGTLDPVYEVESGGQVFACPSNAAVRIAVELSIELYAKPTSRRTGDLDNRVKTLIDSLRVPSNQELAAHVPPGAGEPMFCLMEDDHLVQAITASSREWHDPSIDAKDALVIISASFAVQHGQRPSYAYMNLAI